MNRIRTFLSLLFILFAQLSCGESKSVISLNGKWQLSYWKQPSAAVTSPEGMKWMNVSKIQAQVPGNVELDLLSAGLIKDPMIGNNVNDLRPWEGYQWCYTKSFTAPSLVDGERLQLFFGGIDCLADVWLNGKYVGKAENMMIEHLFDVTDMVHTGSKNILQVIIRSPVIEGQNYLLGVLSIGNFPSEESVSIRKAPHTYGWDILPRLVSAGLWRDVELRVAESSRLRDVHYMVMNVDTATRSARVFAEVQLTMPFEKFDKAKAVFTFSRNGREVYKESQVVVAPAFKQVIDIKNADLWWPRGYGEPALYDAEVKLVDAGGRVLAIDRKRVGLRTVKLDISDINLPNNQGHFCFVVNGEPIFVHGTNWVPMDALHSRDRKWVDESVQMAVDLNCNMIRCWGGNVYEDNHFFDLCDENGIMVWQDFVMGCSFYPQRSFFAQAIEKEVISVVCKLRNHPSLVLWSGNNENDASLRWSLQPFNLDPNKDKISREVIPNILYEFDPTRPYLPSSPYYSEEVYKKGSDDIYLPENHLWGPRGYYKDKFYTDAACTFVSEIGYHGCPNLESLKKMMTPDCVYPWSEGQQWNEEWLTKSVRRFPVQGKTNDRNNLMINQIRLLFGDVPVDLSDYIFASQSVQAEAMKYFIEMWRGKKFAPKTGIIWWNLRDGWPLISDAIVDYYNSKKMAYSFIKNVQKDVCVFMNDAINGTYPLIVVNDTRYDSRGIVKVMDAMTGKVVYEGGFVVSANWKNQIALLPEIQGQGMYLISYSVEGRQSHNHYLYGNPPFDLKFYRQLLKKAYPDLFK